MAKKMKWHYHSAMVLMKNEEMKTKLKEVAEELAKTCGSGYEVANTFTGKTRANVSIYAADFEARKDNLKNNTLAKVAKGGGR